MNTKTTSALYMYARRPKARAHVASFFSINIFVIILIGCALIAQALLVNHLNTINFLLDDLTEQKNVLSEENAVLQERVAELQSLENLQLRAEGLGMVPVGEFTFLKEQVSAVAHR